MDDPYVEEEKFEFICLLFIDGALYGNLIEIVLE